MGVFAIPLSLFTALIATSRLYEASEVLGPLVVVIGTCVALLAMGTWLIYRGMARIHRIDLKIEEIKQKNEELRHLYYDGKHAMDELPGKSPIPVENGD